ncbi:hypothetical protein SEVIR_7G170101v4 [Setaria viridis]
MRICPAMSSVLCSELLPPDPPPPRADLSSVLPYPRCSPPEPPRDAAEAAAVESKSESRAAAACAWKSVPTEIGPEVSWSETEGKVSDHTEEGCATRSGNPSARL